METSKALIAGALVLASGLTGCVTYEGRYERYPGHREFHQAPYRAPFRNPIAGHGLHQGRESSYQAHSVPYKAAPNYQAPSSSRNSYNGHSYRSNSDYSNK